MLQEEVIRASNQDYLDVNEDVLIVMVEDLTNDNADSLD